jgi:hypothetical protein
MGEAAEASDAGFATGIGEEQPITPPSPRSQAGSDAGGSSVASEFFYAVDAAQTCMKSALLIGKRTLECILIDPEFCVPPSAKLGLESYVLAALPEKSLRTIKAAPDGPLIAKCPGTMSGLGPIGESCLVNIDLALFTHDIYGSTYAKLSSIESTAIPFTVKDSGQEMIAALVAPTLVEDGRRVMFGYLEKAAETASKQTTSSKTPKKKQGLVVTPRGPAATQPDTSGQRDSPLLPLAGSL